MRNIIGSLFVAMSCLVATGVYADCEEEAPIVAGTEEPEDVSKADTDILYQNDGKEGGGCGCGQGKGKGKGGNI